MGEGGGGCSLARLLQVLGHWRTLVPGVPNRDGRLHPHMQIEH